MGHLLAGIDRAAWWVIAIVMAAMTLVVSVQVLLRYGFNSSLDWADDVGRLLFVASVFFAIPLGIKEGAHIAIDALVEKFPPAWKRHATRIWAALAVALMAVVCWKAAVLVVEQWDENLPTLEISSALFLVPVCWGAFHSALHLLPVVRSGIAHTSSVLQE
jgi:TRAP-type C4-dicarboxylate transport system permease small subunit